MYSTPRIEARLRELEMVMNDLEAQVGCIPLFTPVPSQHLSQDLRSVVALQLRDQYMSDFYNRSLSHRTRLDSLRFLKNCMLNVENLHKRLGEGMFNKVVSAVTSTANRAVNAVTNGAVNAADAVRRAAMEAARQKKIMDSEKSILSDLAHFKDTFNVNSRNWNVLIASWEAIFTKIKEHENLIHPPPSS